MLTAQRAAAPAIRLLSGLPCSSQLAFSSWGSLESLRLACGQELAAHCTLHSIGSGAGGPAPQTALGRWRCHHTVGAAVAAAAHPGQSHVWSSNSGLHNDAWPQLRAPVSFRGQSPVAFTSGSGPGGGSGSASNCGGGGRTGSTGSPGGSGQQMGEQRSGGRRSAPSPAEARAKARRIAPLVGVAAGAFGSLVGVGGGVLIVPAIVGACPGISQRCCCIPEVVLCAHQNSSGLCTFERPLYCRKSRMGILVQQQAIFHTGWCLGRLWWRSWPPRRPPPRPTPLRK